MLKKILAVVELRIIHTVGRFCFKLIPDFTNMFLQIVFWLLMLSFCLRENNFQSKSE